jgi:ABC-type branched-subunit amino acid transport system ATPase component
MTTPLLRLDGVHAGYRDVAIIRGVSLHVDPGEVVCVIGPNGAGKSTVLKAIMGLLRILHGEIVLAGENITSLATERHVDVGIGYVPQVANVFAALTVRENLILSVKRRKDQPQAIEEVLQFFPELRSKLALNAGAMSGGERQMLAFARCLIVKPRLLLLDEPTAALSPLLVGGIFQKIKEIAALGTAVLLVEQNAIRALEISDRAIVLSNGANAAEGTGAELLANPRIKELYLGGKPSDAAPRSRPIEGALVMTSGKDHPQ